MKIRTIALLIRKLEDLEKFFQTKVSDIPKEDPRRIVIEEKSLPALSKLILEIYKELLLALADQRRHDWVGWIKNLSYMQAQIKGLTRNK